MVTVLLILVVVLTVLSLFTIVYINKLQKQINLLDKEQHIQNEDIYKVMKENYKHQGILLQHIEILKYLVDQDPKLNSGKMYFTGPVGEA